MNIFALIASYFAKVISDGHGLIPLSLYNVYLWSADADHAGVVPAGGVAEDGDEHEHPGDDLETA